MTRFLRTRGLFWTFAGAFLAVLILATLLQVFVVGAVLHPIAERWLGAQAELLAKRAAEELAALPPGSGDAEIEEILHSYRPEAGGLIPLFRGSDGRVLAGRRLPPGMEGHLADHPVEDWDDLDQPWREGPPRPRALPDGEPQGRTRRWARLRPRVLGREAVETEAGTIGEVIVLGLRRPDRPYPWPHDIPRPLLLYLPIAVLLACAAGLIMVRLLLRRLRLLEDLAARVTQGDLDARVPHPGGDEIGRLAERMNLMTESLAEARRREEESERQRRQLLADISHELATPLTSIRGYTETLLEPRVPVSGEERAAYLGDILEESKRMDLLIQDLLDLARLESGAIELEKVRLDWTDLSRNTMERFRARFDQVGIALRWEGPAEPAWVQADGRRLEQVLENTLVNALRYVPSGGTVTLSLGPVAGSEPGRFRLAVSDDGPGFSPEDLPHVFDRFYRADAARSAGGSGLGLAIVKEIVRRHGGEVHAENLSPHGASIVVDLPAA